MKTEKFAAELDINNNVLRVIVIDSPELAAQLFGGVWVESKYSDDTNNYASKGDKYHPDKKNFSGEKPYDIYGNKCNSFELDDNCRWKSKKQKPLDDEPDKVYVWDELKDDWVKVKKDNDGLHCKNC